MSQEIFWVLLSKKLADEATEQELRELEALILEHPEWQYAIQNLEEIWKQEQPVDVMQEEDAFMLHLHRMNETNDPAYISEEETTQTPVRKLKRWYWAAAASLIAVAAFFIYRSQFNGSDENSSVARQINEISTRPGSKSRVQLPDGSVVWLNAGSKLTYNKDFGKETREVVLTGEGFFDVMKMKEKPFIIHTSSINIKVLGTVFNVKAYPEDKQTETSLIRGSIEVTIKNRPNDKIILSPSEKLVVENSAVTGPAHAAKNDKTVSPLTINTLVAINKLKYNPVDSTVAETQWIDNKFVFRDESFSELIVRMERWYDVQIDIDDAALQQKRFSGIFEQETIAQALEALKITVPFKYEQNGNKIIIHR